MKKILMSDGMVWIGDPEKFVTKDGRTKMMDSKARVDAILQNHFSDGLIDGEVTAGDLMTYYDKVRPNDLGWDLGGK